MLKKFMLKNYKNFRDCICIDFENTAGYQFSKDCVADSLISKMLIYGRNATGKTNLGRAIMDIYTTMGFALGSFHHGIFLNADSEENTAYFSYTFQFGKHELIYTYARFSVDRLQNEELRIDETLIFRCDYAAKQYKFDYLHYIGAETANIERFLQSVDGEDETVNTQGSTLPFLRWVINNVALKKDSTLIRLSEYVRSMIMYTESNNMPHQIAIRKEYFCDLLKKEERIQDFENFLNSMGIKCKLVLKKLPDGQYELYFAHEKLVPFFDNASSGALALAALYHRFIPHMRDVSFIYLDEFDAFYHYEMAENIIKYLKKQYPQCQIVMTSHNTNLMTNRLMRPDCLFILSREGTLTALCNATQRELREGHNLEKMYISGEFEKYE
ncbi:MAG: ATP-binding protein [Lachnospiraceae bacterium]|nr:ATP-binding protein [Lachnospiraceae bacterium]